MKLRLLSSRDELQDVRTFIFEPEEKLTWTPGQYMHYVFPHPNTDDRGVERWFTISAAPFEEHITITTRLAGDKGSSFKKALIQLKPGDTIEADGPKGKFVLDETADKHVFIAGGIGITPFRSMLVQMDHDGQDLPIELLYANRNEDFVFGSELDAIATRHPSVRISKFVSDRRVTIEDLRPFMSDEGAVFYVSGPEPMVDAYKDMLEGAGVAEERVKKDYFPGY